MVEQVTRVYGTGGILTVEPKSPSERLTDVIPSLTPVQLAVLRDYLTRSAADIAGIRSDMDRDITAGNMRLMSRLMEESIQKRQQQGSGKEPPQTAQAGASKAGQASDARVTEASQSAPPLWIA